MYNQAQVKEKEYLPEITAGQFIFLILDSFADLFLFLTSLEKSKRSIGRN